jgi:hypothetical protein
VIKFRIASRPHVSPRPRARIAMGLAAAGYRAAPGYDPVTGWGSPNARALVPLLTCYARR